MLTLVALFVLIMWLSMPRKWDITLGIVAGALIAGICVFVVLEVVFEALVWICTLGQIDLGPEY